MKAPKTDSYKQFLTEVFPEELKEIKKRQENLSVVPNEHINKAIDAYEKFQGACKDYEDAKKKKYSPRHRITVATEKIVNTLKMLGKLGVSKPTQPPEKPLEELEKRKEYARELLKKDGCPATNLGLVGLALSGGGIRSATFNLGVLQVLSERGILKHIDYLSTVSGGGYIGSCLSSVLNNPDIGTEKDKFPFRHQKGVPEPEALKHLRNYGNYIAPNGFFDWLKMPALFIRGALINLLLLLPYVAVVVLLTVYFYGGTLRNTEQKSCYIITESARKKLESQGLPNKVLEQLDGKVFAKKKDVSIKSEYATWFEPFIMKQINKRNFSWDWKEFYSKYYLTCGAGILYLFSVFLFIGLQGVFNQNIKRRACYDKTFGIGLLVVLICVLIESMVTALSYYLTLDLKETKTIITTVASLIPVIFAGKAAANVSKWRGKLTIYFLGMIGPFILFLIYLLLCEWALNPSLPFLYWILAPIGIFLFTRGFTEINKTSFHNFYRDQLSKAYLFQTDGKGTNVKPEDKQKLSELNGKNTKAPYHLINVALNLHGSDDLNLHGRNADFFIFSKHFCGGMKTGFCKTQVMEDTDHHVNLGTAMAISGAAASPNMGTATIKPLVFIMTLLNIRLGYWLPNPQIVREKKHRLLPFFPYFENHQYQLQYWKYSPFSGVGPIYLLRELFGLISEKSEYINVSDGGHIENLAIFELLRRRCKYIIACDAEADPDMTFGGLAKLIRYARTDLSIEIEIDLDDVRKGENEFSNRHCAFGKIHYDNNETGYFLYIKSSMTGDENEYIREYRSKNKDFPHESTADQFFDEAQFEAYRALGYHIADKLEGWKELEKDKGLDKWFEFQEMALLTRYRMQNKFVNLQVQLSEIEKMYQDTDISEYTYQIYPELICNGKNKLAVEKKDNVTVTVAKQPSMVSLGNIQVDEERFRKIFHFCNQQMQLMENVFLALQLDKPYNRDHHRNRGWMNLFRRWAEAPFFRWSWVVSIGTYSLGFQMFCEDVLKLHRIVRCRFGREDDLTLQEVDCLIQRKNIVNFFDENRKLLPQYQIWIAEMSVCTTDNRSQSESFPVGFIIIEPNRKMEKNTYQINLLHYQIRNIYRQMRLLEKMVLRLMCTMRDQYGEQTEFCVIFETEEDRSRYGYFFERNNWAVQYVREGA